MKKKSASASASAALLQHALAVTLPRISLVNERLSQAVSCPRTTILYAIYRDEIPSHSIGAIGETTVVLIEDVRAWVAEHYRAHQPVGEKQ